MVDTLEIEENSNSKSRQYMNTKIAQILSSSDFVHLFYVSSNPSLKLLFLFVSVIVLSVFAVCWYAFLYNLSCLLIHAY
jgi:hypothetical protein